MADAQSRPASRRGGPRPGSPPAAEVAVRPLRSQEDFRACVELQRATWGAGFTETVPPAILQVVQKVGGVAAGAFDGSGTLLGFVFGITGVQRGRIVHWSDMLAVREEARGRGIGALLKRHQREVLAAEGVEAIQWTFDPLSAGNAHLNLNRLGARVVEYVRDMYGPESTSRLHAGIGTDRFVVEWEIAEGGAPAADAMPDEAAVRASPVVGGGREPGPDDRPPVVRIEIPPSLDVLLADDPAAARRWRLETRAAFERWMAGGYRVRGLHREPGSGRRFYLLTPAGDG